MQLINNEQRFGLLTKLLHWSIFILFVIQFYLVYRREYFSKDMPEKLQYILLHKSLGVILLGLAFLMMIFAHMGKRPRMPDTMGKATRILAKSTHGILYLCMLLMPISGIFMSILGGRAVKVFDWFSIPLFLEQNKDLAGIIYNTHLYTSYVVIGIVSLHVLGALYHHFKDKDNVLKRMTWGA